MNKIFFHEPDHAGGMPDCCYPLRRCLRVLPVLIVVSVASLSIVLNADQAKASNPSDSESGESLTVEMRQAGIARFRPEHWGMVKGRIGNSSDRPATSLTVVTPAGSDGLQFAASNLNTCFSRTGRMTALFAVRHTAPRYPHSTE